MTSHLSRLVISGIVHNSAIGLLSEYFGKGRYIIRPTLIPTRWLTNFQRNSNSWVINTITVVLKSNLRSFLAHKERINRRNWRRVDLFFDLNETTLKDVNQTFELCKRIEIYKSRRVGILGIKLEKFDLSLEFDLVRKPEQYQMILTRGYLELGNLKFVAGKVGRYRNLNTLTREQQEILTRTFIAAAANHRSLTDEYLSDRGNISCNSQSVRHGHFNQLENSISDSISLNERWRYKRFLNCTIHHGQLIECDHKFYLPDPTRQPRENPFFNSIPNLLFKDISGEWGTPIAETSPTDFHEVIFLGGTNNLMHTVLEDLPRIIHADRLSIPSEIPIVVSDRLSPQIIDLITEFSKRKIFLASAYSQINVAVVHFFEFRSPLPEIMSGDYSSDHELMTRDIAYEIQSRISGKTGLSSAGNRRILILREPELFRRLVNLEEIRQVLENRYGFESYFLSNVSFEDVRVLFGNAQVVVGEYGAALANSIHMRPKSHVIEICGPLQEAAREYQILIEALSINHTLVVGRSNVFRQHGLSRSSYEVELKDIVKCVDHILDQLL